jgi:hypothetical protein
MADHYDSDNSMNDVFVPYGIESDSDNNVNMGNAHGNGETPPDSPIMVDPYINPDNPTEIPAILDEWRMEIDWPQYDQQPFDPTDFPFTQEPPHHTVPLLVAKLHEFGNQLDAIEFMLGDKATQRSVAINRDGVRGLMQDLDRFGILYNENLTNYESFHQDHNTLVDELNVNRLRNTDHLRELSDRIRKLEKKMTKLKARKPSTSGIKKKKKKGFLKLF